MILNNRNRVHRCTKRQKQKPAGPPTDPVPALCPDCASHQWRAEKADARRRQGSSVLNSQPTCSVAAKKKRERLHPMPHSQCLLYALVRIFFWVLAFPPPAAAGTPRLRNPSEEQKVGLRSGTEWVRGRGMGYPKASLGLHIVTSDTYQCVRGLRDMFVPGLVEQD